MESRKISHVKYMGVKIDNIGYEGIIQTIQNGSKSKGYISLTCVESVVHATRDKEFFKAINNSLLSIADGMPLAWYGKLLGCGSIQRISGPYLMQKLLNEKNGFKHFLLGDTEQTINKIIESARKNNKSVKINGYSPPFKDEFTEDDNKLIFENIHKSKPDIIWVSFGVVKQEKWMYQNLIKLKRGIMIGVGAAFRYYIGEIKVPPLIIQDLGLQWFSRLLQQPKKTAKGQILCFPQFIFNFPAQLINEKMNLIKLNKKAL